MKRLFWLVLILGFFIAFPAMGGDSHKGEFIIGPRLALGAVYGATFGFAGQVEYVLKDDVVDFGSDTPTWLGIGGSFAYSSYSEDFFFLGTGAQWKYTNIVFLGTGFFHANFFNDPKWDTYAMLSMGVNTGSVKYQGTGTSGSVSSPTVSGFTAGLGVGARYYFSEKAAVAAEVGIGISALRIGVDFRL